MDQTATDTAWIRDFLNDVIGPLVSWRGQAVREPGPWIEGARPQLAAEFVARDEMQRLHEALTGGGVATVCALQGMRGVGKSQLASAFAQECEQAGWRFVGWVDASSRENAASELAGFARTMGVSDQDDPQEAAKAFVNWLNSTSPQEGLLVFDNVEQADDVTDLIPHGPGMRVLITTTGHTPVVGTPVEVGVYSPAQAIGYLEAATGLGEDLGWLPVAITQAAAAIKEWDYDYVAPTRVALTGNISGPESEYRLALNRNNQWPSRLKILT